MYVKKESLKNYPKFQPRCKNFPELASKSCEIQPDPEDSCCKIMTCPDPKAMDDLKPVGLPFDGCTYKNTTYKQVRFFNFILKTV
jgi:hypothetical protein